jgi:hypothetical protein
MKSEIPELIYSTDQENFNLDSVGEVLDSLNIDGEALVGQSYWVGEKHQHPASYYFSDAAEHLLEQAQCQADDDAGEHAESFTKGVIDIARKELDDFVQAWADKHLSVDFWTVRNVREIKLTEEDLT